jgi:S1-C subfamily serine protease
LKRVLPIILVAALAGGLAGALIGLALAGGETTGTSGPAQALQPRRSAGSQSQTLGDISAEAIYRMDAPGVVVITDTQTQESPPTLFGPRERQQIEALGSGFVIDKQGDIVTNNHVVQGASQIRVGFSSGASYSASLVGTDPTTDIAIVRVDAPQSALRPLAFDMSSKVEVGDPVYAIGNPFGLDRTMTAGIVSAVGRDIQAPNGLTIPNVIQTDAPINHGNSAGPLIDRLGRVIGINSQIEGGTVNANVGIGFAISSEITRPVAEQLLAHGNVEHAWLGVGVETLDPYVAHAIRGLPGHGAIVTRVVRGSPAAEAGLTASNREVTVNGVSALVGGDVITSLDGKPLYSSTQLADAVALSKPGDRLTLEVVRDGTTRTVEVRLGTVPRGR